MHEARHMHHIMLAAEGTEPIATTSPKGMVLLALLETVHYEISHGSKFKILINKFVVSKI